MVLRLPVEHRNLLMPPLSVEVTRSHLPMEMFWEAAATRTMFPEHVTMFGVLD